MTKSDFADPPAVLVARGISKAFPGVKALDSVDFELRTGEIHGVCGENGAGKSTLMKILAGLYRPDQGEIAIDGRPVVLHNPLAAKRLGILLVHQELSVVPDLSVAENLYLGELPLRALSRVDWKKLHVEAQAVLDGLGCSFSASASVRSLSIAQQQQVEIARAVAFRSRIVIFDEPTASLTQNEADRLFATMRRLKEHGVTSVYISHKMREIFAITDRITVLRDGVVTGVLETSRTDEQEVTRLMIGRRLDQYFTRARFEPRAEVIRVEDLRVPGRVHGVSFSVRQGEVVGLYGLVGAGRSEIAEAIFGTVPGATGRILWRCAPVSIRSSRDAIRLGIGLVPEDRKRQGIVPGLGPRDNIAMGQFDRLGHFGWVRRSDENALFLIYRRKLRISAAGPRQSLSTLSGGNQQKVVIARWLARSPRLLILDEPTRGIDIGAKAEIHALIAELAEQGLAVLVISSEMPEILGISHRILTVADGRITSELALPEFSEERLIDGAVARNPARPAAA